MAASTPPASGPIVDAHHHVWDTAVRAQPWLDSDEALAPLRRRFAIEDLAPLAAEVGVTSTVVVQTVTEPDETPELLALACPDTLVAAVVGWTDLAAPGVADEVARLSALPGGRHLAGIRHPLMTEPDPGWIARPEVRRGLAGLAAAGLAFDLVLQPAQLPAAVDAAARLPGLTFVLEHLGNVDVGPVLDTEWAAAFTAFARLPNTACKLSGILSAAAPSAGAPSARAPSAGAPSGGAPSGGAPSGGAPSGGAPSGGAQRAGSGDGAGDRDQPVTEQSVALLRPYFNLALHSFGPHRLMFGSDWPVCTLSASYADVVAAAVLLTSRLSAAEQAAILGGTARAVYHIDQRRTGDKPDAGAA